MYYYIIYKTTNLINGKYYIGKHKTKELYDDYLGSGKLLERATKKYGREYFVKEILEIYDQEWKMNVAEKILVVPDKELNYNLCVGGKGGFGYINKNNFSKFKGKNHTKESKLKMCSMKGKKHTEETIIKMQENHFSKTDPEKWKNHLNKMADINKKPKNEEHKRKLSEKLKNIPHQKIQCPHCKIVGSISLMKRWKHIEKCELKCDRPIGAGFGLPS